MEIDNSCVTNAWHIFQVAITAAATGMIFIPLSEKKGAAIVAL